jgi:hypothetical protein
LAIYEGVIQFARAVESLPPRSLPKYLVALTDDQSDTDEDSDDHIFNADDPCVTFKISSEKCVM